MNNQVLPKNPMYLEKIKDLTILINLFRVANIAGHSLMFLVSLDKPSLITKVLSFALLGAAHQAMIYFTERQTPRAALWFVVLLSVYTFVSWCRPDLENSMSFISFEFIFTSFFIAEKRITKLSKKLKEWRPFYKKNITQFVVQNTQLIDDEGLECSLCKVKYSLLTTRACCGVNICITCNSRKHNAGKNFSKCHQCSQPCDVRSEVYTVLNLAEEERMISFD